MTKVLYWTPEFYPEIGGIEELSRRVLPTFQKIGYEFLVITSHGRLKNPDLTDFNGIPVHRFHFREALGYNNLKEIVFYKKRIEEIKKSFQPHIVHYHWGDPNAFFHVITMNNYQAKTLVTLHTSVEAYCTSQDTMIYKLLENSSWVAAVSNSTLSDAVRSIPKISSRSSVIYNGLKRPEVDIAPLDFDPPKLLCVGRTVKEKGFDVAISALKKLHKDYPDTRLIIAGNGVELNNLKKLAGYLNLSKFVDFMGWIDPQEIPGLINKATFVVIPSRWSESFPLVALEAAQMGRPIVATRVGGMAESVVDNKTGILVEKDNPVQLSNAIKSLLENKDKSIKFGENAIKRISGTFTLEKYVREYDRLYKKIANM